MTSNDTLKALRASQHALRLGGQAMSEQEYQKLLLRYLRLVAQMKGPAGHVGQTGPDRSLNRTL